MTQIFIKIAQVYQIALQQIALAYQNFPNFNLTQKFNKLTKSSTNFSEFQQNLLKLPNFHQDYPKFQMFLHDHSISLTHSIDSIDVISAKFNR